MPRFITTLILLCCCTWVYGEVRLPSVISSNMVLQQNASVRLWGWAAPNEKIKVHLPWSNTVDSTVASGNANWSINIKTPAAGGPYTITIHGRNIIKLENVMIGEVWVCSGQSNMEWNGNMKLKDILEELPVAKNPNIRLFHITKTTSTTPQDNCPGEWKVCDSASLHSFSAVGYFFGKKLQKDLNVPIGLINTSWGGTPAEVWTPEALISNDATLKAAATRQGANNGRPHLPGYTYNAMIAPITQYAIAGAIWYQGESNAGTSASYTQLMSTMIGAWRKAWGNEFPFYFVQIAPYRYGANLNGALLREAQTATLSVPRTGMAVITDLVDDTTNIHPQNKHDVGLRLANIALTENYKKTGIVAQSPLYDRMEKNGSKIVIHFKNADGGLKVKGSKKASEFYIAGEDHVFVPAEVKVDGDKVIVSAKGVKQPEAVRFGFTNTAMGNLFNSAGLPVGPFRTDNW